MQPDEVRIHDTREWIARSREDLDMAAFALTAKPPFLRDCLFHCQQALEKAFKAFLTFHDESFTKTHNLIDLGLQCARADGRLRELAREAAPSSFDTLASPISPRSRKPGACWPRPASSSPRFLLACQVRCSPAGQGPLGTTSQRQREGPPSTTPGIARSTCAIRTSHLAHPLTGSRCASSAGAMALAMAVEMQGLDFVLGRTA